MSKSTRTRVKPACARNDNNAEMAYNSACAAERIAVLYEESQFLAAIARCHAYAQHFLQIWTELSSFNGDDSQSNTYIPITPEKSEQLQARNVDEDDLMAMQLKGRHLQWVHARGSDGGVSWADGPVMIFPND